MGWQLAVSVSWLRRLEASHTICFSHQQERERERERARPRPLNLFFHLHGFSPVDTKRFNSLPRKRPYVIVCATGNTKHLSVPLGIPTPRHIPPHSLLLGTIPPLVWKIMSHLVRSASSVKNPKQALWQNWKRKKK